MKLLSLLMITWLSITASCYARSGPGVHGSKVQGLGFTMVWNIEPVNGYDLLCRDLRSSSVLAPIRELPAFFSLIFKGRLSVLTR